jgi:tRNA-dihydrouridine synthase
VLKIKNFGKYCEDVKNSYFRDRTPRQQSNNVLRNTRTKSNMNIGSLALQSNILLSPLEGVSDVGFRHLCYANGAGITWTEMIRGSGIVRKNKATLDLIDTYDPATLTGIQIFAVNERELGVALYKLEQLAASSMTHIKNIRAVDLNFGCPSPDMRSSNARIRWQ